MNDLKATVILIRWKKHSNQMEARPGALGEGVRRALRFSLALTRKRAGRRRASHSSQRLSGCSPASARFPELRNKQPHLASERKQRSGQCAQGGYNISAGTRSLLLCANLALRSVAGDPRKKREWGTAGGARNPGQEPQQMRGCHPARAQSSWGSKRENKKEEGIRGLTSFHVFRLSTLGFQIIGLEGGAQDCGAGDSGPSIGLLRGKNSRKELWKSGFGVPFRQ
jgi:hypothetical protein